MTTSLLPARYNLVVRAGASWRKTLTLLQGSPSSPPQDLSGYTAQMVVRPGINLTPSYTLSTANSQITLGGVAGTIALYIPSTDTLNTTLLPLHGSIYELTIIAPGPGDGSSLMWGNISVKGIA